MSWRGLPEQQRARPGCWNGGVAGHAADHRVAGGVPQLQGWGCWTRSGPHTACWCLHPDGCSAGSDERCRGIQPAACCTQSDPRRRRRGGWCRAARGDLSVQALIGDGDRITGIRGHTKAGSTIAEKERLVVGADGRHLLVARSVQASEIHHRPRCKGPTSRAAVGFRWRASSAIHGATGLSMPG